MSRALKIDFIGAGNLAWNLAPALERCGASVINIYSQNIKNAAKLAGKLYEGQVKEELDFSNTGTDIIIIAVADDAIEDIAKEIILTNDVIVVHTSGSVSITTLGYLATSNIGVFYPLQTFTKNQLIDFSNIPICIEAENKLTNSVLTKLAKSLSSNVLSISSSQRQQLHLAAVFSNNFTNWLLTQSHSILKKANLDLSILQPLLEQSISKAIEFGPSNVQTGPAKRQDFEVLDKHLELLSNNQNQQEIYKIISQQIVDHYQEDTDE